MFIKRLQALELAEGLTIDWVVSNTPADLLSNNYFINAEFDFSILNTIYSHFQETKAWLQSFNTGQVILTVHNANFWFKKGTRYKVFKRPRSLQHKEMLDLLKMSSSLLVLSDNVKKYIKSKYRWRKSIIVFPYSINERIQHRVVTDNVIIAVPGVIEEARRDYELVLTLFRKLDVKKYKLKLLGQPIGEYGKRIADACEEMVAHGYQIDLLKSPDCFEQEIAEADIIFAPINIQTSFAGIAETYGLSKESGVIFDIVRYAIPGILPDTLTVTEEIKPAIIQYSTTEELIKKVLKLSNADELNIMKKHAVEASEKYRLDNISESFFEALSTNK